MLCWCCLVLLDMSAAFDTVNHEILLTRLHQHFGICDTALDWFKDYLHDHTQFVNIEHSQSNHRDLLIGVPQGSVWDLFCVRCIPYPFLNDQKAQTKLPSLRRRHLALCGLQK